MQDFDTLRDRVEETTDRLKASQTERQSQTESLVTILRQLEEKHAAQSQQLAYYQKRLQPLEQANQQLAQLMEGLLDLIDSGFGEESLVPLRDASRMATEMLESDLFAAEADTVVPAAEAEPPEPADIPVEMDGADDEIAAPVEMEDDPADAVDMDVAGDGDLEAVAETDAEASEEEAPLPDLEMEEDALISLDDLLDMASEEIPEETVSFEETEIVMEDPADAVATESEEIIDDGGFDAEIMAEEVSPPVEPFKDVSNAVLELESEEDEAAGYEDLPDVVKDAMAAFDGDEVDAVPEIPPAEAFADAEPESTEDDLATIAALAQQIEEETANEGATPPAQSDIRALLLRVEALAKKAEAMRLAQKPPEDGQAAAPAPAETPQKQAGAAA